MLCKFEVIDFFLFPAAAEKAADKPTNFNQEFIVKTQKLLTYPVNIVIQGIRYFIKAGFNEKVAAKTTKNGEEG